MDIDNLLKELRRAERYCLNDYSRMAGDAATALSTLQAENEKLRKELEWKDMVIKLAQRKQRESEAALRREQDG